MRRFFSLFCLSAFFFSAPAHAVMEDYPSVKLQGLDKSVGRTITFEATVGSTIQYGPLFIKIHACRKAPPIEKPESAAFLQIWEVPPGQDKSEWVFSGWMFASSPALSAMDHPVYDVWVLDCLGKEEPNLEAQAAETNEEADQADLPAADGEAGNGQPIPTDSEAEPEPAPAPAEDAQQPVDEQSIPTDSEAEPEVIAPEQAPALSPDAAYPAYDPNAAPVPVAPVDPAEDKGLTAYDLMPKQGGGGAEFGEKCADCPEKGQPPVDPNAPYGYR